MWVTIEHLNSLYGIWDNLSCELYLNLPKKRAEDVAKYFNEHEISVKEITEIELYTSIGRALLSKNSP